MCVFVCVYSCVYMYTLTRVGLYIHGVSFIKIIYYTGAGEMTQQLRALVVLLANPDLIPSPCTVAYNCP